MDIQEILSDKKYRIYLFAVPLLLLAAALFYFLVLAGNGDDYSAALTAGGQIQKKVLKQLPTEVLAEEKFKSLQANNYKIPALSELDIGNDQPFR